MVGADHGSIGDRSFAFAVRTKRGDVLRKAGGLSGEDRPAASPALEVCRCRSTRSSARTVLGDMPAPCCDRTLQIAQSSCLTRTGRPRAATARRVPLGARSTGAEELLACSSRRSAPVTHPPLSPDSEPDWRPLLPVASQRHDKKAHPSNGHTAARRSDWIAGS